MKTHSKISLLVTGSAALLLTGNTQAGGSPGQFCSVKKSQAQPKVHHHKVKHHTCKVRTACQRGHHQKPRHKPHVRPVHNETAPFHIKPCHPCSFKPLNHHRDPSHWYNKLADLA